MWSRCLVKTLTGDEKPLVTVVEIVVEIVSTEMIGSLEDDKPSSAMDGSIEIMDTIIHRDDEIPSKNWHTRRHTTHNTQHTTQQSTKQHLQPFHFELPSLVSILESPTVLLYVQNFPDQGNFEISQIRG